MQPSTSTLPPSESLDEQEWQQGLQAILAPLHARGASAEEVQEVTQRARAFYEHKAPPPPPPPAEPEVSEELFATPIHPLPSLPSTAPASPAAEPPYPLSFAALAQLIATGQPVPGIRDIPDQLAEGEPSVSKVDVARLRKPWEKAAPSLEDQGEEAVQEVAV